MPSTKIVHSINLVSKSFSNKNTKYLYQSSKNVLIDIFYKFRLVYDFLQYLMSQNQGFSNFSVIWKQTIASITNSILSYGPSVLTNVYFVQKVLNQLLEFFFLGEQTYLTPIKTSPLSNEKLLPYIWKIMPIQVRSSVMITIPCFIYYGISTYFQKWPVLGPPLLSFAAQLVGITALQSMLSQLKSNLGVVQTMNPQFLTLSTWGNLLYTFSHFSLLGLARSEKSSASLTTFPFNHQTLVRVRKALSVFATKNTLDRFASSPSLARLFFGFNCIYTALYAYGLYLSARWNTTIRRNRISSQLKNGVHIPSMILWTLSTLYTVVQWIQESHKTFSKGQLSLIFSYLGFVLSSLGSIHAGYISSMTSIPQMTPFKGIMTYASAILLAILSILPYFSFSGTARVYLAGYFSMWISMLINAFHSFREELRSISKKTSVKSLHWPFQ